MWIRSREVKFVLPQRVSVLELECICNLLFFKDTEASTKFSCNISVILMLSEKHRESIGHNLI